MSSCADMIRAYSCRLRAKDATVEPWHEEMGESQPAYWFRKSPHFGAGSLPQGMIGTVEVEFCGDPSMSLSV